jgi:Protein of unknown function (DUF1566)
MRKALAKRFGMVMLVGVMVLNLSLAIMADRALAAPPSRGGSSATTTQNWDTALPPDQRFTVLAAFSSQAVRDNNTGLVWELAPDTTPRSWGEAAAVCLNKTSGGQKGWRLPSIPELTSLIDPSVVHPAVTLQAGHPFINVQPGPYWSATSRADDSTNAWLVHFGLVGGEVRADNKTQKFQSPDVYSYRAWCVRGPMNADQY